MFGLLGRELELTEHRGHSRVLAVVGEPGIGKSRLAVELGHSLPAERFLVGRCVPFGDRPPFAAIGDAVAQAIGLQPGADRAATSAAVETTVRRIGDRAATALAADLRTLLGAEPLDEVRSDRDAVRAARLVLEDLAREGTVAVVLDDLQWADRSLRDLLADLHRDPWPAPVFVLGLSRERVTGVPMAALPGLDRPSMRHLAAAMLGDDGSGEAVTVPVARANGNALFLEEMLGMLIETGAVRHADGGWHVVDPGALRQVPTSIRLLIAARLDALPPDEKQVLLDAAVCGAVAWDEVLVALCHVEDVRASIDGLLARDLLHPTADATVPGATAYGWKHALIRDVAYDAIPKAVRAERHVEIARWLRGAAPRGREPVAAIGVHYERAWELTRRGADADATRAAAEVAATYLTRSAEQMFRRQARAAAPLYRRALRAADEAADDLVVARAAVGLAEVLVEMGEHPEAIEQASRAQRLAERAGDRHLAALAMLALGRSESDAGRMRRARTVLEEARSRFEAEGDLRGQGWALHRLSETWGWADFERELGDLREAYGLFTSARDRFGREVVAHDLAYILSVEGGPEFRRWYRQAERLTEDEGDLRAQALLLRTWGGFTYAAGRFSEAAEVMGRCRPLAVDAGDRYAEADALVIGALARVNVDAPAAVEELVRDAMALGRELGSVRTPTLAKLAGARAAVRAGRPDVGARQLRAAREAVRTRRIKVMAGDVAEAGAMFALDRGAWSAAIDAARELAAALRAVPMSLWNPVPSLIRGRALLGAGRAGDALPVLDQAVAAARASSADGTLALARVYRVQAGLLAGRRPRAVPASASSIPGGRARGRGGRDRRRRGAATRRSRGGARRVRRSGRAMERVRRLLVAGQGLGAPRRGPACVRRPSPRGRVLRTRPRDRRADRDAETRARLDRTPASGIADQDERGVMRRTSVGAPGAPPAVERYSGIPTQVSSRPSSALADHVRDAVVGEGHPAGRGVERVREEMEPPFDEPRGELGLPVAPVVDRRDVGRADRDERRLLGEPLLERQHVELVADVAGPYRLGDRPPVDAGRHAVHGVDRDDVGHVDPAGRREHRRAEHLERDALRPVEQPDRPSRQDDLVDRRARREGDVDRGAGSTPVRAHRCRPRVARRSPAGTRPAPRPPRPWSPGRSRRSPARRRARRGPPATRGCRRRRRAP